MKTFDVVALGELLVDFTENGLSAQGNPLLEANPGGAPCNVLSMLQNLGKKTAFIGKEGIDMAQNRVRSVDVADKLLKNKRKHSSDNAIHGIIESVDKIKDQKRTVFMKKEIEMEKAGFFKKISAKFSSEILCNITKR